VSIARSTVYVVDDDAAVLKAVSRLLEFAGHRVETYGAPEDFLDALDAQADGCAVLDLAMPQLDGLQLQQALAARGSELPIIFLTGHGDIPTSVRAMKDGAADFLTKPVRKETLLGAVASALQRHAAARAEAAERRDIRARLATLTPREREVMAHVVAGKPNKRIAAELGTVVQTVKVHRGRVMHKMGAKSLADLVRMADHAGVSAD